MCFPGQKYLYHLETRKNANYPAQPTKSETLCQGPSGLCFTKISGNSEAG